MNPNANILRTIKKKYIKIVMPNHQSRKNIPYYSTTRPKTPPSNLCPLKNFITTSNE